MRYLLVLSVLLVSLMNVSAADVGVKGLVTDLAIGNYCNKEMVLFSINHQYSTIYPSPSGTYHIGYEADGTSLSDYWTALLIKYVNTEITVFFSEEVVCSSRDPYGHLLDHKKLVKIGNRQ